MTFCAHFVPLGDVGSPRPAASSRPQALPGNALLPRLGLALQNGRQSLQSSGFLARALEPDVPDWRYVEVRRRLMRPSESNKQDSRILNLERLRILDYS